MMRFTVLIAIVLGSVSSARADQKLDADAKLLYDRGESQYKEHDYVAARAEFSAGYELSHRAQFLFNMAECSRLGNEPALARQQYERYLKEAPTGELATLARQRLAALPPSGEPPVMQPSPPVTQPKPVTQPPVTHTPSVTPPPLPPPTTTSTTQSPETTAPASTTVAIHAQPVTTQRSLALPITFGAVALASVGAAIGFDMWGNSTYNQSKTEPDPDKQASLWHSANEKRYAAAAFGGVGIVSVGLATWFLIRGEHSAPAGQVGVAPIVASDRAGLVLTGGF